MEPHALQGGRTTLSPWRPRCHGRFGMALWRQRCWRWRAHPPCTPSSLPHPTRSLQRQNHHRRRSLQHRSGGRHPRRSFRSGWHQRRDREVGRAWIREYDLRGRAVTPGFIDNHGHFMEEGAYWQLEKRLDGVESRKQAAEMIRERAKVKGPGQWVFTLGGWSPDQFADDPRPFTRDELRADAPTTRCSCSSRASRPSSTATAIDATGDGQDQRALGRA